MIAKCAPIHVQHESREQNPRKEPLIEDPDDCFLLLGRVLEVAYEEWVVLIYKKGRRRVVRVRLGAELRVRIVALVQLFRRGHGHLDFEYAKEIRLEL